MSPANSRTGLIPADSTIRREDDEEPEATSLLISLSCGSSKKEAKG